MIWSDTFAVASTVPFDSSTTTLSPTFGTTLATISGNSGAIKSLAFVDTSIKDVQDILASLQVDDVILLDASQDGIAQITTALSQYQNLDSIHLISHGKAGSVRLGTAELNTTTLGNYSEQLSNWQSALAPDADVMVYGCNVAADLDGQALVLALSSLTGADVAASTDLTGNSTLGGNWALEYQLGQIDAAIALDAASVDLFQGILAPGTSFNITNFATAPNLQLNLNASRSGSALRLTPAAFGQRGSAFYVQPVAFDNNTSFNTQFQFQLNGGNGTSGADGFTFVLQNTNAGAGFLGGGGGNLGYAGTGVGSLAIEFDTFQNGSDPNNNHVAVIRDGSIENPLAINANPGLDLNGGGVINAWVDYTGSSNQLQLFLSNSTTKPTTAALTTTVDIPGTLGGEALVGFTAATGGLTNNHDIRTWRFDSTGTSGGGGGIVGSGTGLQGQYYDNIDFTNLRLTRTDPTVNFDWGTGSPATGTIAPDTFSVVWSGQVQAQFTEDYRFFTTADDGVRLFVNNQLVINNFVDQPPTERSSQPIALTAGQLYDIRIEYYERGGGAVSRLAWSSPSTAKQFIPTTQLYTPAANLGTIALEQNTYSINEADGTVGIGVVRTGSTAGAATVQFRADSGTATSGTDFTATNLVVQFAPGQSRSVVNIPITNDTLVEGNENFTVVVQSPTGANLGTIRTATVTIVDNDSSVLTFNNPQVNENAGTARVTVTRGNGSGAASVDFATANGTAIAGSDYTASSGRVSFVDGQTSAFIDIPLVNNTIGEPNETFQVNFSNPVGATLGSQTRSTVTVIDDDPGSFLREVVVSGLNQPTTFSWTPDNTRMFILEKSGLIKIAEQNAQGQWQVTGTFADLSYEVNDVRDRGALGLALHPDFGRGLGRDYVYVAYTYDPPQAFLNTGTDTSGNGNTRDDFEDPDNFGNRPSRVVRLTANASNNLRTAVIDPTTPNLPGEPPRTDLQKARQDIIVGTNSTWANTSRPDANSTADLSIPESGRTASGGYVQNYLKTDSESHSIGQLAFGADGALYFSNGDGTSYNAVDPRTLSVLDVNSLSGKILRIDPLTGQGLSDNPFWNGDANSNASKVWNLGLRNPFRFAIQPGTSTPFIGDVGWKTWEEVNVGARGANFGWPAFEGGTNGGGAPASLRQPEYDDLQAIQDFYNSGRPVTAPAYARNHNTGARAIVMGDFYDGNTFPSVYNGALFVSDVNEGTVDALTLNSSNQVTGVRRFASGLPGLVQMATGSDGNLYYVNIGGPPGTGTIGRWRPETGGNSGNRVGDPNEVFPTNGGLFFRS